MGSTPIKLVSGLILCLLVFPSSVIGANYFVKTPAQGGSDSHYYGAWLINSIAATYAAPNYYGRLGITWYFQCNGSYHFDAGIRTQDLEGNPRPVDGAYDMGAFEYFSDAAPPTGSIVINSGAACTASAAVALALAADDPSGVALMQFSNDNVDWFTPQAYSAAKQWDLAPGSGPRTVYVKYRDNAGNWSGAFSDSIFLSAGPGDVNLDGILDLADAVTALQMMAGMIAGGPPGMVCGDADADGRIALTECLYLLQEMAGLRP